MPGYFGVQLALELSNILPVREVVQSSAAQVINFARLLRKSGSDVVVEEDLAEVFGRGRISPKLESDFTNAVKIQRFIPLRDGCEIELHSGPGPTLSRALRDRRYMATVIQLSLLGWTHKREDLASALATAMRARHEAGVPGASLDPGCEGIMNTLAACSSQTSNFSWTGYSEMVEEKLRREIPGFRYSSDYTRLSPALVLGAMDFLYKVQSLPEDRKIVVSNQIGSITFIIWAHYILGLDVTISGNLGAPVFFGSSDPQVIIEWTKEEDDHSPFAPRVLKGPDPEVRLLDGDMSVLLRVCPDLQDQGVLASDDRHPLLGWGTTFLRRTMNTNEIVQDDSPIYQDLVQFITAAAVYTSRRLFYDMLPYHKEKHLVERGSAARRSMALEVWRVIDAADVAFGGIDIDRKVVKSHIDCLHTDTLIPKTFPNAVLSRFSHATRLGLSFFSASNSINFFFNVVDYLTEIILSLAHVAEIKSCAQMPIRIAKHRHHIGVLYAGFDEEAEEHLVKPEDIFHFVSGILSSDIVKLADDVPRSPSGVNSHLFLVSDFGWSVFFDTLWDKDPAEVRPDLVHVVSGTPTNIKTMEQKFLLRDGVLLRGGESHLEESRLFSGATYLPRCAAKASKRRELWSSRAREFELTLHYSITLSSEWRHHVIASVGSGTESNSDPSEYFSKVEDSNGFRAMQAYLWHTYLTPDDICAHQVLQEVQESTRLGPNAAALLGWDKVEEIVRQEPWPQRILVLLTRGNRHIRWLAMASSVDNLMYPSSRRRLCMLRSLHCCDDCALQHVSSQPGRWALVL